RRLLDGNEPHAQRWSSLASQPDRLIDQAAVARLAKHGNDIDLIPARIKPTGVPPASAHQKIATLIEHMGHPVRLQMSCVGVADLALDHRDAVEPFALSLIGKFHMPKAFARQVERAVEAPQLVLSLGRTPRLRN